MGLRIFAFQRLMPVQNISNSGLLPTIPKVRNTLTQSLGDGVAFSRLGIRKKLREITQLEKQGTFNLEPNQATLAIARALP